MTPLINFRLYQLYPILVLNVITIYLSILRSYYSHLAGPSTQLTIPNSKEFIQKFKRFFLDSNSKLVSSLLTSALLDFTIDVILRQIYREKEILHHMN